ncbi:MAG: response regulator [Dehalococcoidia bacterium]|nr:response regulator [Dehalococcoidia bacterium]
MKKNVRILLIDDDVDFVKATTKVLQSKPYEVIAAYDGKEGLEKARSEKPDLILLDILMPKVDGFAVAEQFKKDQALSKIPVLALTSFSDSYGQPFSFEVSDFIQKPVSPKDLLAMVEKHLGRLS